MKFSHSVLLSFLATTVLSATPSGAFAPHQSTTVKSLARNMVASLEPQAPPAREAPGAGYLPDWEDRPGKTPAEFMQSDLTKPDRSAMWECPLTRWNSEGYVLLCFINENHVRSPSRCRQHKH
jgi:hypothetical protein